MMSDPFRIFPDFSFDSALQQKSRTRGQVSERGGISLPETEEALGMDLTPDVDAGYGDLRNRVFARIQEISAGRATLAGIGAQIEDDVSDQTHDPLLPLLYADLGIRLPAILAIDLLGLKFRIATHRNECNVALTQKGGRGEKNLLTGNIALNDRVHWYRDESRSGITIAGGLSETMRIALIGQPLARLLSHPRLDPLALTIVDSQATSRMAIFQTDHVEAPVRLGDVRT